MHTPWLDAAITDDDVAADPQVLWDAGAALAETAAAANANVVTAAMASLRIMILIP